MSHIGEAFIAVPEVYYLRVCVGGVSKTSPFSSVPLSGTQAATTAAAAAAAAAASRIAPVSPTGTQAAATTSGW